MYKKFTIINMILDLENLNYIFVNIISDVFEKNKDNLIFHQTRKIKFIFAISHSINLKNNTVRDSRIYSDSLIKFYTENVKSIPQLFKYISMTSDLFKIKKCDKYIKISWLIPNDIIKIYDEIHYFNSDWLKLYISVYNYLSNNNVGIRRSHSDL